MISLASIHQHYLQPRHTRHRHHLLRITTKIPSNFLVLRYRYLPSTLFGFHFEVFVSKHLENKMVGFFCYEIFIILGVMGLCFVRRICLKVVFSYLV